MTPLDPTAERVAALADELVLSGVDPLDLARALVTHGTAILMTLCGRQPATAIVAGMAKKLSEGER